MSSEERDDMAEDQSSDEATDEVEGDEEIYEVDETEEEAAESFDDDAGGPRRRGSRAGTWVIIILVIAVIAALVANHFMLKKAEEEATEQQQDRKTTRERQIQGVVRNIPEAELALQRGDLGTMLDKLRQMDEKLGIIATAAVQAQDAEEAQRVAALRKSVSDAIDQLSAEYEEIEARMAALQTTAAEQMGNVRRSFTGYSIPAPPTPPAIVVDEEQAPGDEAATDAEAAAGDEAAAEEAPAEEAPAEEAPAEEAPAEEAPAEAAPAEEAPAEEVPAEAAPAEAAPADPQGDVEVALPEGAATPEPAGVPPGS